MKNKIRLISVVVLTAIYCFAIGAVYNTTKQSDFNNNVSFSKERVISELSEKIFCHTYQSESSVNSYNNPPAPNIKKQFTGSWATLYINEQLIESEYSQYLIFTRSILINLRKSDIIFPFQYFW